MPHMMVPKQTLTAILETLTGLGISVPNISGNDLDFDQDIWAPALATAAQRRSLPLEVGLKLPVGALGIVDYMMASSATVAAAITLIQQVFPLVAAGVQMSVETTADQAHRMIFHNNTGSAKEEGDMLIVGAIVSRMRHVTLRPLSFPVIELSEPHPNDPARWQALLGCRCLKFGTPHAAIKLSHADWNTELHTADPRLLTTLADFLWINSSTQDNLIAAVRALASQGLPHLIELGSTAKALGLSRRTLQRKLAISGTSLHAILDEVRRDRARKMVEEHMLPLGEIASRVGFAEQSSFTRAWRRWFGNTPTEHNQTG